MAWPGPVLLLIGPLLGSMMLLWLRRWRWVTAVVGAIIAAVLWLMLTAVPLQPTDIELSTRLFAGDTYTLWQQPLILTEATRSLMLLIYAVSGVLFLLSGLWPAGYNFVPVALASLSPMAAAWLIQPFAFAAVCLFIAWAGLVLVIQPERAGTVRPALRYLLIGLLATCLFLIAGWMIEPGQTGLQASASRLLGIAFVMFMAGFPFYIWVIPVARRTPLLARVFVLGLMPLIVTIFLLELRQEQTWLAQEVQFTLWLRWSGLLTVLVAGLSALTAGPRRLLSSLVLLDMGMAILVVALGEKDTAVTLHLARIVSLLLAGLGLERDNRLLFSYGCASLLGLPLTPGFFGHWPIFTQAPDTTFFILLLLAGLAAGMIGWWHHLNQPPETTAAQPTP